MRNVLRTASWRLCISSTCLVDVRKERSLIITWWPRPAWIRFGAAGQGDGGSRSQKPAAGHACCSEERMDRRRLVCESCISSRCHTRRYAARSNRTHLLRTYPRVSTSRNEVTRTTVVVVRGWAARSAFARCCVAACACSGHPYAVIAVCAANKTLRWLVLAWQRTNAPVSWQLVWSDLSISNTRPQINRIGGFGWSYMHISVIWNRHASTW
jgi:hypothetical protein